MFKTMRIKLLLRRFGHSYFENLNLFRNWGPARRVGSPKDQFRYSNLGFEMSHSRSSNSQFPKPLEF
jgi:hypothetical protein